MHHMIHDQLSLRLKESAVTYEKIKNLTEVVLIIIEYIDYTPAISSHNHIQYFI